MINFSLVIEDDFGEDELARVMAAIDVGGYDRIYCLLIKKTDFWALDAILNIGAFQVFILDSREDYKALVLHLIDNLQISKLWVNKDSTAVINLTGFSMLIYGKCKVERY